MRPTSVTIAHIRSKLFEITGDLYAEEPPPVLYHYTDHSGLVGIASSKALWATHLKFMNDERELEDGIAVFQASIRRALDAGRLGKKYEPFDRWHGPDGPRFSADAGIYAVCFSEKGDDLSQWRAYCAKGGYALGVNGPALGRRAFRQRVADLCKVVYDNDRKQGARR